MHVKCPVYLIFNYVTVCSKTLDHCPNIHLNPQFSLEFYTKSESQPSDGFEVQPLVN